MYIHVCRYVNTYGRSERQCNIRPVANLVCETERKTLDRVSTAKDNDARVMKFHESQDASVWIF